VLATRSGLLGAVPLSSKLETNFGEP
jgi:hypothetical protein